MKCFYRELDERKKYLITKLQNQIATLEWQWFQRENAGVDFVASMVRFRGGQWRMVLTPEQFNTLLQAALQ